MKPLSYLILMLLCSIACNTKTNKIVEKDVQHSATKYCYITSPDMPGKEYLSKDFLDNIASIATDLQKKESLEGMVFINGGRFAMGADIPDNYESMQPTALPQKDEFPKHEVSVNSFYMDVHEVNVGEFEEFVKATQYVTVAERDINWEELKKQLPLGTLKPSEDDLKAGSLVFNYISKNANQKDSESWWSFKKGISWKNPDGSFPNIEDIKDQSVTHVSWYDALAYAKWVGKRLPTEAEYEYAMRGGEHNTMYP